MKKILSLLQLLFLITICCAQAPNGYYNNAIRKSGEALKIALHEIISDHESQSYSSLWDHFYQTDSKPNGKVWDIYSDIPDGTPPYEYSFGSDQCGNYNSEGVCYNREHSMPKSWFNDATPMYTDLFHLYPTDGWVNNKRSNFPFGEVATPTWTSQNGSKLGSCATSGYNGTVFEPIDAYKGDLARTYFYMSTRYMDKNLGYENGSAVFNGSEMKDWAVEMFIRWHQEDPVSQKEIERNNAIWRIQENRNPYIDYPELVEMVFGDNILAFNPNGIYVNENSLTPTYQTYPNPVEGLLYISHSSIPAERITLFDLQGRILYSLQESCGTEVIIDMTSFSSGFFILQIENNKGVEIHKIIKN